MHYTTLNRIRERGPCAEGWETLLKSLGKTHADDEPVSLRRIVESNGIYDAIWVLRAIDDCPEIRLFAVRCARQVQHLMTDERSINALDVAERYAIGEATQEEMKEARDAAWDAAHAVDSDTAWCAAWTAVQIASDAARGAVLAIDVDMLETIHNDYIAIFCQEDYYAQQSDAYRSTRARP